ncbi:hypothetical protein ACB092_07G175200 [Castanea dentata]
MGSQSKKQVYMTSNSLSSKTNSPQGNSLGST